MRILTTLLALASLAPALMAGLTPDQKELDLRILAAQYAKYYAPYQWKQEFTGFDLYNLGPWIARARAAKTDMDFYQVCGEYVASLEDSHSSFSSPSLYRISLPLHADYYQDVPRIDSISRAALPVSSFPFQIGDEVVAVDGVPIADVVAVNSLTVASGNHSARRRTALQRVFSTSESSNPRARNIGDEVALTIRSRTTGEEGVYTIPVTKFGVPLAEGGTTPSPTFSAFPQTAAANDGSEDIVSPWLAPIAEFRNLRLPSREPAPELPGVPAVLGFGIRPGFPMPSGFVQRLGRLSTDSFFSGTYTVGGKRIGFIRIPTFAPSAGAAASLRQFDTEIQFFNDNTDGLVIDIMRNGGGDGCYTEELLRRLIPYSFQGMGFEIRASFRVVSAFYNTWQRAIELGAPPHVIALVESHFRNVESAYRELRGRSGPVPICSESLQRLPHPLAYSKPLVLVADEYSSSASDVFSAVIQDSRRGPLFGYRTNGAGGAVNSFDVGPYSEATASVTVTLMARPAPVSIPGYPTTSYIENVGVYPDMPYDFMSLDNLLSGGVMFRDAVTDAILAQIATVP
ncbi:MAG: hypothetical protein IPJ98_02390 [Bryobacterales bacterium]|nr:hypothetical protein [Bryobacterales bacterium]